MRTPQFAARSVRILAVPLLAGVIGGVVPAAPAAAAWTGPAASFTTSGSLVAVAATSASNAWAVGYTSFSSPKTLIVRWNGESWKRVPSPGPADGYLYGVAAVSARSAWAVGCTDYGTKTLVLRWNGKTWK